jgi:hypothetical protein
MLCLVWGAHPHLEGCSQTPVFAQCKIKAGFEFSSGAGAVLVMDNDTITTIDPPGILRRLLLDKDMRECVIISEVHSCSSYARLICTKNGGRVAIGLSIEPPISEVASATVDATWVRSSSTGNFKQKVYKNGSRTLYPLFRLVSLKEKAPSTGVRGGYDGEQAPLPDASPPWLLSEEDTNLRSTGSK